MRPQSDEKPMSEWSVQDAKVRFSEMLAATIKDGPQMITKRGVETAIIVPIEKWRSMTDAPRPTVKDLLLADEPRYDLDLPKRGEGKRRPPLSFAD